MSNYSNSNIFPDYTDRDLNNLFTLNTCKDSNTENCLFYMFKNGKDIYKQIDMFNTIPEETYKDKLIKLFDNKDSLIMTNLLSDSSIKQIMNVTKVNDRNKIINFILMHIKPVLFSNGSFDINTISDIRDKVVKTLIFNNTYMQNLETQVRFLLSNDTIGYIKNQIETKLKDEEIDVSIKNDYISSIMHYEIDNYRQDKTKAGKASMNKNSLRTIEGTFLSQQSLLKDKDIFTIINDVIAKIYSTVLIENNVEKNNKKLDKWDTILGDNNRRGLRQYSSIKLREKKPQSMLFNMNY